MSDDYTHLIDEIVEAAQNGAQVTLFLASKEVVVTSARHHGRDRNMVRVFRDNNELVIHGSRIDALMIHGPTWLDPAA